MATTTATPHTTKKRPTQSTSKGRWFRQVRYKSKILMLALTGLAPPADETEVWYTYIAKVIRVRIEEELRYLAEVIRVCDYLRSIDKHDSNPSNKTTSLSSAPQSIKAFVPERSHIGRQSETGIGFRDKRVFPLQIIRSVDEEVKVRDLERSYAFNFLQFIHKLGKVNWSDLLNKKGNERSGSAGPHLDVSTKSRLMFGIDNNIILTALT